MKPSFFMDPRVSDFLLKNKIPLEKALDFSAEIKLYVENFEKYDLSYNSGYIELISKSKSINQGITYLDQVYFAEQIDVSMIDISSNAYKQEFLNKVIKSQSSYYLTGSNGIGKTFITIALANLHFAKTGKKTLYVFWPDFINKTKNFKEGNLKYIAEVTKCKRLIIDDLGQESVSQWSRDDILNTIISYRCSRNLETFITSNFSHEELLRLYTIKPIESKKAKSIISKLSALCDYYVIDGMNYREK